MVIEACDRAEQVLRELVKCASDRDGTRDEFRVAARRARALIAMATRFQSMSVAIVAEVEGHGDGGEQLLADVAGLSRRDAKSQVKTDRILDKMPAARAAVDAGEVSQANARALANAVDRVGLGEVASDPELLEKAASESPEKFTRNLRRWAVEREGDDGASEHVRQRKNRGVTFFTADDGMTHMHGKFDAVTGKRIENRFQALAKHRWKHAKNTPGSDCTKFDHAMADILDTLTSGHYTPHSNTCNCQTGDTSTSDGSITPTTREPGSGSDPASDTSADNRPNSDSSGDSASGCRCGTGAGSNPPFADIAIEATLSEDGERLLGEISGGDRLPPAVLEELMCNARFTGVLFNQAGTAIWQGHSIRVATEAQRRHLIRTYGGCFHCGAHPTMCQAHHIIPFSQGGKTDIDNLVLVCWTCHQRIHHNNWQIHTTGGTHTLHPPGYDAHEQAADVAAVPEPAELQLE